jgi:uncharacterized repeat protein (TIGR03837 family)
MRWDLFCRVIDNYGDIGVSWRLAADLAARGEAVRLWVDDPTPLHWMAPTGFPGVEVVLWRAAPPDLEPGDVVIETFGCDPPPGFVARMAALPSPPAWINLEYLSAEPYVERSHGLLSPQHNGLRKWFFYPGFVNGTGGLLRERGLMAARAAFDRETWLSGQQIAPHPGERLVSLFAYAGAPTDALLDRLAGRPTLLLLTAGMPDVPQRAGLRVCRLPWLSQRDFDHLLWSCDLNLVRGEDSIVRAMWAGAPFVWHIYPQHDGVHARKLEALLSRMDADPDVHALWRAWNGLGDWPDTLPSADVWTATCAGWREALLTQPDLVTQLMGFVTTTR